MDVLSLIVKSFAVFAALLFNPTAEGQGQQFFGCGGYQFSTYQASWEDARLACQNRGYGDLVAFDTPGEYEHVRHLFKKFGDPTQTSLQYWTSGTSANGFGILVWHSSGVLMKHTPEIIKYISEISFLFLFYRKCAEVVEPPPFTVSADMGATPRVYIQRSLPSRRYYFVCEQQTVECRINKSIDVGSYYPHSPSSLPRSEGDESYKPGANAVRQSNKNKCYTISHCKTSQLNARLACQRRNLGDLLSIETKSELDYVLALLREVRSGELYWTGGVRTSEVAWDTTNKTLPLADMPEDFESYFRQKHPTLGLAISSTPTKAGGAEWRFLEQPTTLKFICEMQSSECKNFTTNTTGGRKREIHDAVSSIRHVIRKRNSSLNASQRVDAARFVRTQVGSKCYVLWHGLINPEDYVDWCRTYNWTAFDMDAPGERHTLWRELLSLAPRSMSIISINDIIICTAGFAETSHLWLATNEKMQYRPPVTAWDLPKRRIYLNDLHFASGSTVILRIFYGWKTHSIDEIPPQRCYPVCEVDATNGC